MKEKKYNSTGQANAMHWNEEGNALRWQSQGIALANATAWI
jgi:hypothetical protein